MTNAITIPLVSGGHPPPSREESVKLKRVIRKVKEGKIGRDKIHIHWQGQTI